jgi:hypothetical protein
MNWRKGKRKGKRKGRRKGLRKENKAASALEADNSDTSARIGAPKRARSETRSKKHSAAPREGRNAAELRLPKRETQAWAQAKA